MISKVPYRPWGELSWALKKSAHRRWHFIGCLSTEDRSIEPLLELHECAALASHDVVRVNDIIPDDANQESVKVQERIDRCKEKGLSITPTPLALDVRVNKASWASAFDFSGKTSICLDISCLPKRFFFPLLRAAFLSSDVKDLIVLYAKPRRYPEKDISSNPEAWSTIDQFKCPDDEIEKNAEKHLIINTGFIVGGLVEYIREPREELFLDILVPFPAEPWKSVQRSWKSARAIEEEIGGEISRRKPNYHRVAALDASSAFNRLISLTNAGRNPAALAPLGPKPTSMAMCLLASQTELHPVYYAQPKTYAINYSEGYEKTFAYWIKHGGESLYHIE